MTPMRILLTLVSTLATGQPFGRLAAAESGWANRIKGLKICNGIDPFAVQACWNMDAELGLCHAPEEWRPPGPRCEFSRNVAIQMTLPILVSPESTVVESAAAKTFSVYGSALRNCVIKKLSGDRSVQADLRIALSIAVSGRPAKVDVEAGTLGELTSLCIKDAIERWHFDRPGEETMIAVSFDVRAPVESAVPATD